MIGRVPLKRLNAALVQDWRLWLRPLLVGGQLLLSIALAYVASHGQLRLFLLLFLGVGLVLAILRWPPLGLIFASLAGLVVPWLGPSGLNATMILIALSLGLWLLDMAVRQRQIRLAPSRAVWPLLAFVVVACLSFGVGQLRWFTFALHAPLGAQLGGLSIVVLSVGTFLLVANQVHDLGWLSKMTWAFLAMAALFVLVRLVLPHFGLISGNLFQGAGSVYYIWLVALAFSQAAFNRDLHPGWRWALAGLILVTLYALVIWKYNEKSGWIPPLVCIAAIIGFRSRRTGLVLILVLVIAAIYLAPRLRASEEYSVSTRLEAWLIVAQIVKFSPIWGLGFANYYWYTPLFPIRGYAVSFNSHNNYVDIVAQTGVVGLVCLLLFFWEAGRLAWRLREQVPAGFAQAYVYGAMGGLVGMLAAGMFGDWVLPFFYNIGLIGFRSSMLGWLFLGGLVTLEQMELSSAGQFRQVLK